MSASSSSTITVNRRASNFPSQRCRRPDASTYTYPPLRAPTRQVLSTLLTASNYSKVIELGRRATTYPVHGVETPSSSDQSKLKSVTVANEDFEDPAKLAAQLPNDKDWGSVFITLGTTRANAGGAAQFEKIDRECEQ